MNIAILGAGVGQIPLIQKAKSRGWRTVVVSPAGPYPGIKLADTLLDADVRDASALVERLKDENISAIVTDQLDSAVETAAYISEQLHLKGITSDVARRFKDKFHMLQCAQQRGINVPDFALTNNVSDALQFAKNLGYPVIIKPHDSAASKGVYRVDSAHELTERYEESRLFSSNQKVLIQKYIEKETEYCVEAYTRNFQVRNIAIGKRDYFKSRTDFIPQATLLKSAQAELDAFEEQVLEVNARLVEGLGLSFGITHGEFMVEQGTGKIYLVEIAARGGGVGISSELVPACSGIDMVECLLDDVADTRQELPTPQANAVAAYFCFMLKPGTITRIQGVEAIRQMPEVMGFVENFSIGNEIARGHNKYARKGPIHVKGKDARECYQALNKIKEKLIISMSGDNSNGVIWE